MPIRLVAVDLDGTIVRHDRTVSERVRRALDECRRREITVVVVTARRWRTAGPLLAELGFDGLAVVVGGGAVRDICTGRVISHRLLTAAAVAHAVRAIEAAGLQPAVAVDHGERHLTGEPRRDGPALGWYLARGAVTRLRRAELDSPRVATRVLAMGPASRVRDAARRCAGVAGHITVQDCIVKVHGAGERVLELHVAAATKGTALRDLVTEMGLQPGDVLAIGDAPSDLPMLELVGTAVLMGQAEPGLRRGGFVVAPPVAEDGAAWAIERFALGE